VPGHDRGAVLRPRALHHLAQKTISFGWFSYGGQKRDERIPDTPTIYEIFDKENTPEESRRVADVILRGTDFGRPWVVPPGTARARVKMLRDAHAKAMSDPELLAEAKKGKWKSSPLLAKNCKN